MEFPCKILKQFAHSTRPKIEEHLLIVLDRSTHEKHLSQPLQTNNEQFEIAVNFLTGCNGIFNVTNSNIKFFFKKRLTDGDDFIPITIPPGAYENESFNKESKRKIIDEEQFTETDYPFQIRPKFSTLGSITEISPQGPIINFVFDDSIRNNLGFHETILYK